ncbi:MAG: hypothetical protein AB7O77_02735 [Phycisphaerales bacterium]
MDASAATTDKPVSQLSLVEIAGLLEKVTSAIEEQRVRERAARKVYKSVADDVNAEIERIRKYARELLLEQRRRLESFNGMLAKQPPPAPAGPGAPGSDEWPEPKLSAEHGGTDVDLDAGEGLGNGSRLSIAEAMLKIWSLEQYKRPLSTDEIAHALVDVGYTSRASPRSMKSTLNQVLAKLCRERKIRRFRTDGEEIDASDTHSRARKYLRA